MRLLIHIGSHKAGSTAIQEYCGVAARALSAKSVLYPTGLFEKFPNQHSELVDLLRTVDDEALSTWMALLVQRARSAKCRCVFLSGENLCTGADDAQVDRLRAAAAKHFSDITIAIVLRDKWGYLLSHYNHFLRYAPMRVSVADFRRSVAFSPAATVERWRRSFGSTKVRIIPYNSSDGRPLLVRFFNDLFSIVPSDKALAACAQVNPSFDTISAFLVNDVMKAFPGVDIQAIDKAYFTAFGPLGYQLPFQEVDVALHLDALYPDEDWIISPIGSLKGPAPKPTPLSKNEATGYLHGMKLFIDHLLALSQDWHQGTKAGDEPIELQLTAQQVIDAYRILLDRLPESDAIIEHYRGSRSLATLRAAILASPEYRGKNPVYEKLNNVALNVPALSIRTASDANTLDQLFRHIQERWTKLGAEKPHWSVLSNSQYENKMTPALEDSFYATNKVEREIVERIVERAGRRISDFRRAFEFGCGVGRMTVELAKMFPEVVACDISKSHLAMAQDTAARRGLTNIDFRLGSVDTFAMHDTFNFWYSRIVLQHNPPPLIEAILTRALGQLEPNGLAIFQVPTYAVNYSFDIEDYVKTMHEKSEIEMHCLPQSTIFRIVAAANCRIIEVREDNSVDIPRYWVSNTFVVEKQHLQSTDTARATGKPATAMMGRTKSS